MPLSLSCHRFSSLRSYRHRVVVSFSRSLARSPTYYKAHLGNENIGSIRLLGTVVVGILRIIGSTVDSLITHTLGWTAQGMGYQRLSMALERYAKNRFEKS